MTTDRDLRPDPEMDARVRSWLVDSDLNAAEADRGLDRLLDEFPVTPQHQARWLGRLSRRGKSATRSTHDRGSPSEQNHSTRRTRFMFSATGLVAGIAVLALAVNTITPTQDPSVAGAEDGVLIVAADGSGEYDTISEAVEAASDGDTITVMPGEYTEAIVIDKDIDLIGEGPVEDIVIMAPEDGPRSESSPSEPYGLLLQDTDGPTVSGLTFRGEPSIVIVSGGSPTIIDSRFEGTGWAYGGGAALDGSSIQVNDGSTATIAGNTLVGGGPVAVFGESVPIITGNSLSGGAHIFLRSAAAGSMVTGNTIDGTLVYAINSHADDIDISGNVISDPGDVGIRVRAGTSRVEGNSISDAQTGISVAGGTAEVIENELANNDLGIGGSGITLVRGNSVRDGKAGIALTAGSAQLEDNVVEGNEVTGISIGNAASPILSGNIVCGNGRNLHLGDTAEPQIDDTNEICEDAPAG